jgi:hypothetical protein
MTVMVNTVFKVQHFRKQQPKEITSDFLMKIALREIVGGGLVY